MLYDGMPCCIDLCFVGTLQGTKGSGISGLRGFEVEASGLIGLYFRGLNN